MLDAVTTSPTDHVLGAVQAIDHLTRIAVESSCEFDAWSKIQSFCARDGTTLKVTVHVPSTSSWEMPEICEFCVMTSEVPVGCLTILTWSPISRFRTRSQNP